MKIMICFLLVVLANAQVWAATLPDKDAAKMLAANVMSTVAKGNTAEAMLMMKPYMIIPDAEFAVLKDQLASQAPMINKRFGRSIGSELIKIDEVGNSLMSVLYIQKIEKRIMRWVFCFYRPRDRWILDTFTTDDNIKRLFCR